MKITEIAVKRPVTTIMFFVAIVIMGLISLFKTPRELLPSLVYPQITVVTVYDHATPEEIERLITKVIEEPVGAVRNLERITSISKEGLSLVMAEFKWGTNMDIASMDVREKIDLIKERLPRDTNEPIVMKFNPFELPVLTVLFTKEGGQFDAGTLYEMKETIKQVIKSDIEKIDDVASVEIKGGRDREILVEVSQARLQASGLSLLQVATILKDANLSYPAGTIKRRFYEYLIRTMGEFRNVSDIGKTPVKIKYYEEEKDYLREGKEKEEPKGLIHLSDIATVSDTFKKQESIFRYNKKECVSIDVKKQSGANVVRIARRVRNRLKELKDELPADYNLQIIYDQSEFIERSIWGVAQSAVLGGMLAFLVLFFFLRNFKNSLIITTAIPISLMGTFILMYFQKISINMMSLGGLALGIGMLVDNAIVVLENIFRHNVKNPEKPEQNAIDGAGEVTGAITSSTLTTITVFLPFIFVAGVAGQLFKELAYTVTFSLIASLVVAITLIPRLSSKVQGSYTEPTWSIKIKKYYIGLLKRFFRRRLLFLTVTAIVFVLSLVVLLKVDKKFIPHTKQNQFIMEVELPPGTGLSTTDDVVSLIENVLKDDAGVSDVTTSIGSAKEKGAEQAAYAIMEENQARITVNLKEILTENIIARIKRGIADKNIDAKIEYITQIGVFGGALGGGAPISIEIQGEDMGKLIEISKVVEEKILRIPQVYGVKNSFRGYRPELKIKINKDRAALFGISTLNVNITAQTAIKGHVATELNEAGKQTDIRIILAKSDREDLNRIGNLAIFSPLGYNIKLSQLASFERGKSNSEIRRKEGQGIIAITANHKGSLNRVLRKVEEDLSVLRKEFKDYTFTIAGDREKMQESFMALAFVVALSLLFVYMIMAAQFESLWQPFIIIFTVPLSIIGVALILVITSVSLSVVAILGIIMLGGIVVNNGIVLISHYNIVKKEIGDSIDKIIDASATRLRPVLMTALTTVLGLIPMAISGGQGAELRSPLAITVIGGLLVSTFLTLFVIPTAYIEGEKLTGEIKNILSRLRSTEGEKLIRKIKATFSRAGW